MTNKAAQEAVRGFGQAPTNYAIETAIDKVAVASGLDRIEVRRRNFIRKDEFPYLIPSGTRYDSGDYHAVVDKVLAHVDWPALGRERDALRAVRNARRHRHRGVPGAERRQLVVRAAAQSEEHHHDLDGFVPHHGRRARAVTVTIHTTSSGQGHETLAATVVGEVLEIDPDRIRVVRPDSLASLPSNSPVGSRMAVMLGGAAFHAAQKLKRKLIAIAAHRLGVAADALDYREAARSTARTRQAARMDRPRHHRAPQHPPDAAGLRARASR